VRRLGPCLAFCLGCAGGGADRVRTDELGVEYVERFELRKG
jgi:hypothetical protein